MLRTFRVLRGEALVTFLAIPPEYCVCHSPATHSPVYVTQKSSKWHTMGQETLSKKSL